MSTAPGIRLFEDAEYHRRRAETEMEKALLARKPTTAMLHLKLAQMHRNKRDELSGRVRLHAVHSGPQIDRADKEG
jgi:hypothetical protein